MLEIVKEKTFEKQIKSLLKKHYNLDEFNSVMDLLKSGKTLPGKYRDHPLVGDKKGCRDCHLDKNIILIYRLYKDKIVLYIIGTHSDILDK